MVKYGTQVISFLVICFTAVYASDSYTWTTVTMGGGGFVSAIITSKTEKNCIYARTDVGGAYRWDEQEQAWIPLNDWLDDNNNGLYGVEALALDPSHSNRIYMLAGTKYWNEGKTMILRSDDYGDTFDTVNVTTLFTAHGNGYGRQNGERLVVDPNNPDILFCGTRKNGLWKSTDRGDSWSPISGIPNPANEEGVCFILFDKSHASSGTTQRIYVGLSVTGDNLFVSENGGTSWNVITLPELSKQVMPQRAVCSPGGRFLYVTTANGAGPGFGNGTTITRGALLKYDTQNRTWNDISPENWIDDPPDPDNPNQTVWDAHFGGYGGISMAPLDSNHLVVSSINTWKPQRWNNSTKAGWGDKIFATIDGGATWVSVFGDLSDDQVSIVAEDEAIAVLDKNGYNWIEGESIHWAGSIEFDPFNTKRVFVTSGNGIFMTDNFLPGSRFDWKFTVRLLEETVPEDLVSIPGGPLITVIADYDGFVHPDITLPVPASRHQPQIGSTTGIDYATHAPNIVVRVGGNDKPETDDDYVFPLYYSEDTGATWTAFATHPNPQQNYRGKIALSADGKVVLWNPEGKNYLLRTDDWGVTWATCSGISGQKCFPTADPINENVFYAFSSGVYRSTDKGTTFTNVGGADFSWTKDMQVTPQREGHIWVTGYAWDGINGGFLARSVDGGNTFEKIDPDQNGVYTQRIQHSEAVGFGKEAPGASYPAIYMYGTIDGIKGIYQSINEGKSWVRVDDDKHQYGALSNGNFVRGDANTFGVVYRSTAGRGIAVRIPSDRITVVSPYKKGVQQYGMVENKPSTRHIRMYSIDGRLISRPRLNMDAFRLHSLRKMANGMIVIAIDGQSLGKKIITIKK